MALRQHVNHELHEITPCFFCVFLCVFFFFFFFFFFLLLLLLLLLCCVVVFLSLFVFENLKVITCIFLMYIIEDTFLVKDLVLSSRKHQILNKDCFSLSLG